MAASQSDFNILFVFLRVWRIYLHILSFGELIKQIIWFRCWLIKRSLHITVKFLCKGVTIVNVKNSFIKVNIYPNIKIFPWIIICKLANYFWNFLSFKENSLRNTWVLNFWLCNVNCLVCQVIVNDNFSDTIIL